MKPFSSEHFFRNGFFTETVVLGDAEISAVTSNIDELKTEGKFASKTGFWLSVALPRSALSALPGRGTKLEARGMTFRIEDVIVSGDVVRLSCLADQRFVK